MTRRTDRLNSLIRQTLAELLLTKLSDPRLDPALTTITSVAVSDDLESAKVYLSVLGTEAQQRNALRAMQHASGRLQERMMRQIRLRRTPALEFVLDAEFKNTLKTLRLIDEAMGEIHAREDDSRDDPDGPDPIDSTATPAES